MEICYNRHYITVDTQGQISHGWSDGPHPDRNTTNGVTNFDYSKHLLTL